MKERRSALLAALAMISSAEAECIVVQDARESGRRQRFQDSHMKAIQRTVKDVEQEKVELSYQGRFGRSGKGKRGQKAGRWG